MRRATLSSFHPHPRFKPGAGVHGSARAERIHEGTVGGEGCCGRIGISARSALCNMSSCWIRRVSHRTVLSLGSQLLATGCRCVGCTMRRSTGCCWGCIRIA